MLAELGPRSRAHRFGFRKRRPPSERSAAPSYLAVIGYTSLSRGGILSWDGSDFLAHSLRKMNHVIVDQHRLPRTVIPVNDHLSTSCHPDGSGGVFCGGGQE